MGRTKVVVILVALASAVVASVVTLYVVGGRGRDAGEGAVAVAPEGEAPAGSGDQKLAVVAPTTAGKEPAPLSTSSTEPVPSTQSAEAPSEAEPPIKGASAPEGTSSTAGVASPEETTAPAVEKPTAPPAAQPEPASPAPAGVETAAPAGDAESQARDQRFAKYAEEGVGAFERRDYQAALSALGKALEEKDDAGVRALFEQAQEKTTKPRIAVAELGVSGDVGIADAGKSIAELLLARFDPERFQLVERSQLAALMKEQDVNLVLVEQDPKVLRAMKLKGVRYLVVGSVTRLGNLSVSARLVDAASGDIVQTAEVSADDVVQLKDELGELAALLQMSSEEKAAYLEEKRVRMAAVAQADSRAQKAAEEQLRASLEAQQRDRRFEKFRARQHERDALVAVTDIKALLARGDFDSARRLARSVLREYSDTSYAREISDLLATAERGLSDERDEQARQTAAEQARILEQRRHRHDRFRRHREEGLAAMGREDYPAAVRAFRSALKEEDDPETRGLLAKLEARMAMPGLAVMDFDVHPEAGPSDAGRTIADYVLRRMAQRQPKLRPVSREAMLSAMRRAGISAGASAGAIMASADRLPGIRYLVVGKVTKTDRFNVVGQMLDLQTRRPVQTAMIPASSAQDLRQSVSRLGSVLLMTDSEKRGYLVKIAEQERTQEVQAEYNRAMAEGNSAARAERWDQALIGYRKAYAIQRTPAAQAGIAGATARLSKQERPPSEPARAVRPVDRPTVRPGRKTRTTPGKPPVELRPKAPATPDKPTVQPRPKTRTTPSEPPVELRPKAPTTPDKPTVQPRPKTRTTPSKPPVEPRPKARTTPGTPAATPSATPPRVAPATPSRRSGATTKKSVSPSSRPSSPPSSPARSSVRQGSKTPPRQTPITTKKPKPTTAPTSKPSAGASGSGKAPVTTSPSTKRGRAEESPRKTRKKTGR